MQRCDGVGDKSVAVVRSYRTTRQSSNLMARAYELLVPMVQRSVGGVTESVTSESMRASEIPCRGRGAVG